MAISPCTPWASEADLCSPCLEDAYAVDFSSYLVQASELLYQLSGQQFPGICDVTIAPCSQYCVPGPTQFEPFMTRPLGVLHPDNPFPWTGCACGSPEACNCAGYDAIVLPHSPVTEVTEVIVDDDVLDDIAYELQGATLYRIDGSRWPTCDDSFRVTYSYGVEPPASGVRAAGVLACELLLACEPDAIPDAKCRLPRNISSITRQGVSVIFDRLTNSGPFRFGIWEIDIFLEAFNPYGVSQPSTIASPDTIDIARRVP